MLSRSMSVFAGVLGAAAFTHLPPFRCAMNGPVRLSAPPTAQTLPSLAAVTDDRKETCPRFGLATRLQRLPFQCSITVRKCWVVSFSASPTAHTSRADTAAKDCSEAMSSCGTGADFDCVQVCPFQ